MSMMTQAFFAALILFVLFVAFVLIRAALFKPPADSPVSLTEHPFSEESVSAHLSEMIRIPTVSNIDPAKSDLRVFSDFRDLLQSLYPEASRVCSRELIGPSGVLYRWKGKSAEESVVFMAHYDVVPATETGWVHEPFSGKIDDAGVLWGRGAIDTKITLCGIMEAVEARIREGFVPDRDIWLSFSGDEEVFGPSAPAIVEHLKSLGVRPSLVLDEGGAVVSNVFPGVSQPCAVVGIAEKGMMNVELAVESNGGHASAPPRRQTVDILARAIRSVLARPFPARLTPASAAMFDVLGRRSSFGYRVLFANIRIFLPLFKLICRLSGGELDAMMRTTCCATTLSGGPAFNVMPSLASAGFNLRLLSGDTVEGTLSEIKSRVRDDRVKVSLAYGNDPSPAASTDSNAWKAVSESIRAVWPEAVPAPYLMVACTDSRHFSRICDNVLKFSAMELSKEERGTMHARNERIPVAKIPLTCSFFWNLIGRLNSDKA